MFLVDKYRWVFFYFDFFIFKNVFIYLFCCCCCKFGGMGYNSLTASSGEIRASLIQVFQIKYPLNNDLKESNANICNKDVSNNENTTNCCVM